MELATQIPWVDGQLHQAAQVFEDLRRVLAGHGATLDDVVKVIVYVTDFSWFDQLSELRERLLPTGRMASTIVAVAELIRPGLLMEVEAVAVAGWPPRQEPPCAGQPNGCRVNRTG